MKCVGGYCGTNGIVYLGAKIKDGRCPICKSKFDI